MGELTGPGVAFLLSKKTFVSTPASAPTPACRIVDSPKLTPVGLPGIVPTLKADTPRVESDPRFENPFWLSSVCCAHAARAPAPKAVAAKTNGKKRRANLVVMGGRG